MSCNVRVNGSGRWYWEDGSIVSDSSFESEEDAISDWKKTLAKFKGSWLSPSLPKKGG